MVLSIFIMTGMVVGTGVVAVLVHAALHAQPDLSWEETVQYVEPAQVPLKLVPRTQDSGATDIFA